MKITPYTTKYKEQVQAVCISQSTSRYKDEQAKQATLALYCDPYINHEISLLLIDEQKDEVCGYVLCAKDLKKYIKNAFPYYEKLIELDEEKSHRFTDANSIYEKYYPEYPAHIHIDIKEEYTGGGNGSQLMHGLFDYLKEINVSGICVLVDPNNIRAVNFYNKMGFVDTEIVGLKVKKLL